MIRANDDPSVRRLCVVARVLFGTSSGLRTACSLGVGGRDQQANGTRMSSAGADCRGEVLSGRLQRRRSAQLSSNTHIRDTDWIPGRTRLFDPFEWSWVDPDRQPNPADNPGDHISPANLSDRSPFHSR